MAKSTAFGVLHLGIAFGVGYALSGSLAMAGALTLVEPAVNTVAHYIFDRWWEARHSAVTPGGASVESTHAAPSGV